MGDTLEMLADEVDQRKYPSQIPRIGGDSPVEMPVANESLMDVQLPSALADNDSQIIADTVMAIEEQTIAQSDSICADGFCRSVATDRLQQRCECSSDSRTNWRSAKLGGGTIHRYGRATKRRSGETSTNRDRLR